MVNPGVDFRKVLQDDQVRACWGQRVGSLLACEWKVDVGTPRGREPGPNEERAAGLVREILESLEFDRITGQMMHAFMYGFSVAELMWSKSDGQIILADIKVKDRNRFRFERDGNLYFKSPDGSRNINISQDYPGKFWVLCATGEDSDSPHGVGIIYYLYWLVLFKRECLVSWQVANRRVGSPILLGEFPPGTTVQDQQKLLQTLEALQADTGAIVPQGVVIKLLEASRSGSGNFKDFIDVLNSGIAKLILGQTLTTEGGNSYAHAKVHLRVARDIIKADSDLISASFRRDVLLPLTLWNFGEGTAPPVVYRLIEEPDDTSRLADRDYKIFRMGFRPTLEYIHQVYGTGWVENFRLPDEEPPAAFSAQSDPVERIINKLKPQVLDVLKDWVQLIRDLLEESASLEEFRGKLMTIFPKMDVKLLTEQLEKALILAELVGMAEVQDGD
ncbi:MAG: DUF935 family protein [Nanopusillaceae archaeon]